MDCSILAFMGVKQFGFRKKVSGTVRSWICNYPFLIVMIPMLLSMEKKSYVHYVTTEDQKLFRYLFRKVVCQTTNLEMLFSMENMFR